MTTKRSPLSGYRIERSLVDECARAIDTSWHNSWHWKYTPSGGLTLDGWRTVREEATVRLEQHRQAMLTLQRLLPQINERMQLKELWAREDDGDED